MTIVFMKKLIRYWEIGKHPMPTLEKELVMILLRYVLPDLNDEELTVISEMRKYRQVPTYSALLSAEGADSLAPLLGDSDFGELKKEACAYAKAVVDRRKAILFASKKKGVRKKIVKDKDVGTLDKAKK